MRKIAFFVAGGLGLILGTKLIYDHFVERSNITDLRIYIESKSLCVPGNREKGAPINYTTEGVAYNIGGDYCKGCDRATYYVDNEILSKVLGRKSEGVVVAIEEKVGDDLWRFKELGYGGKDMNLDIVKKVRKKIPWIFEGIDLERPSYVKKDEIVYEVKDLRVKPYKVNAQRDSLGRVNSVVYTLHDGRKISLFDDNSDCIAERMLGE